MDVKADGAAISTKRGSFRDLALLAFWVLRFFYFTLKERSWAFLRFYPGYHGSAIPSRRQLERDRDRIFPGDPGLNDGIDLHRERQLELLNEFATFYPDFDVPENRVAGRLYYYNNQMYGFNDAFILYSVLRKFRPQRVIEVGSGFSSALMLDLAQDLLPATRFTFIDPYSETIQRVAKECPGDNYEVMRTEVQKVDPAVFAALGPGDVFFIDTSHSLKIASDLSDLFFQILPSLPAGVIIHIHDIFFPWEYPEAFVLEGRTYNEIYFVRAFLQFNNAFEVLYHSSQMEAEQRAVFDEKMPGYFKASGKPRGKSLWLRKVR